MKFPFTCLPVCFAVMILACPGFAQDKKPEKLKRQTIKAIEGLQFSPPRFSVKKGEAVELKIENHDPNDQPHNFVLIKPGKLQEIQTASMAVGPESVANGFVPKNDSILVHTGLLNPEGVETIKIEGIKEKGIYPFVCTFPGHAMVMYGALYVDEKITTALAFDPNVPEIVRMTELEKTKALMAVERPTFSRAFLPKSGPAAIAVALKDDLNFCWDAGNCRLRYIWTGGFIDATRMYNSNGSSLVDLLGPEIWNSGGNEKTMGLQIGAKPATKVDFKGYQVIDGVPEFKYAVDGVAVREYVSVVSPKVLTWRFKIESPQDDVLILAPDSDAVSIRSEIGKRDRDHWVVPQAKAAEFTLTITQK